MLKKNDFLIITLVILVAAALGAAAYFAQRNPQNSADLQPLPDGVILAAQATSTPQITDATSTVAPQSTEAAQNPETTAANESTAPSANAYLLVTVGDEIYEPIPLMEEGDFTLYQNNRADNNVVHVTTDSVSMKSASCDNQDCVEQGVVSLENRNTRVLQNMIVCLPNKVMLELLTAEEAQAMLN